jgi:hypothetical protein
MKQATTMIAISYPHPASEQANAFYSCGHLMLAHFLKNYSTTH